MQERVNYYQPANNCCLKGINSSKYTNKAYCYQANGCTCACSLHWNAYNAGDCL